MNEARNDELSDKHGTRIKTAKAAFSWGNLDKDKGPSLTFGIFSSFE